MEIKTKDIIKIARAYQILMDNENLVKDTSIAKSVSLLYDVLHELEGAKDKEPKGESFINLPNPLKDDGESDYWWKKWRKEDDLTPRLATPVPCDQSVLYPSYDPKYLEEVRENMKKGHLIAYPQEVLDAAFPEHKLAKIHNGGAVANAQENQTA